MLLCLGISAFAAIISFLPELNVTLVTFLASGLLLIGLGVYKRRLSWQLNQFLSESHNQLSLLPIRESMSSHWLLAPISQLKYRSALMKAEKDSHISTFNAIADGVIKTDATGRIFSVNVASEQILNKTKSALLGRSYGQLIKELAIEDVAPSFQVILDKVTQVKSETIQHKSNFPVTIKNRQVSIEQRTTGFFDHSEQLAGTVIVLRDVTNEAKLRDRLRYQANHDSVTKLYNRFKFEQRLVDAWNDAQSNMVTHALLQIDMDRFKLVNDNAGHGAGDQLLREVGVLIRKCVRQSDVCARIGGDEFAILLYQIDEKKVITVMEKINMAFDKLSFSYSGQVFDVGASIGGTLITKHSPPIVEVKRQADAACYLAKNEGINGHKLFNADDQHSLSLQQEPRWAARINQALEQDQFELFYQPIRSLDLIEQDKHHIEILLRLKSGNELLSPNVFLPAVERFRLSDRVDFWVVSKTFDWFESHPQLWESQVIAINLSGDSLKSEDLINQILSLYKKCNFPAEAICFEITETAAIASMSQAAAMVEKLRYSGFSIALDDFGKGFSTFSYLKSLPAQYIKIDGSYVKDILDNTCDYSIVCAISTMAKTMNMKTIAEFVQCDETVDMLRKIGIDFVQGYGIAKPASLADYASLREHDAQHLESNHALHSSNVDVAKMVLVN